MPGLGANVQHLLSSTDGIDLLTGMPHYSGVEVTVRPLVAPNSERLPRLSLTMGPGGIIENWWRLTWEAGRRG